MNKNPCLNCGVCCKTYRIAFHWSEVEPMGSVPSHMVIPLRSHEVMMRGTETGAGPCVALTSLTIDGVDNAIGCSIHGRHPSVCRDVEIGSDQCQRARARHGLPMLTTMDVAQAYASDHAPATSNR